MLCRVDIFHSRYSLEVHDIRFFVLFEEGSRFRWAWDIRGATEVLCEALAPKPTAPSYPFAHYDFTRVNLINLSVVFS